MDRATMLAFVGVVVLGGVNGVGIGVLNNELAPIWGAALRFGLASVLLVGLAAVRRVRFPRGQALVGSVIYGFLYFGVGFGLIHWALVDAPPGMTQVILSVVPLLALLLASAHGVEPFRRQGLAGALLAVSGVAVVFGDRLGGELPVIVLLAILGGALAVAEGTVAVKRFPSSDPGTANAIAMAVATSILLATSLIAGEAWSLPATPGTWTALIYLVAVGSVVVFVLFLHVVSRWTASATSYVWPLFPLVAVPFSALVLGEPITPMLLLGAALVVIGVYLGAFAPPLGRPSALFREGAS
jgi:drug/metabolite transporter (DMT)-like permease